MLCWWESYFSVCVCFLVGMLIGAATMETSIEAPQNIKMRTTI